MNNDGKHSIRIAVITAAVSFFFSAIFTSFFVGQRTGKVIELDHWKRETAPRIEKMDLEGSVATKNFIQVYDREQAKQYAELKELRDQVKHLETMSYRIDRLEKEERKNHSP